MNDREIKLTIILLYRVQVYLKSNIAFDAECKLVERLGGWTDRENLYDTVATFNEKATWRFSFPVTIITHS